MIVAALAAFEFVVRVNQIMASPAVHALEFIARKTFLHSRVPVFSSKEFFLPRPRAFADSDY
jgi:hypothetical protein